MKVTLFITSQPAAAFIYTVATCIMLFVAPFNLFSVPRKKDRGRLALFTAMLIICISTPFVLSLFAGMPWRAGIALFFSLVVISFSTFKGLRMGPVKNKFDLFLKNLSKVPMGDTCVAYLIVLAVVSAMLRDLTKINVSEITMVAASGFFLGLIICMFRGKENLSSESEQSVWVETLLIFLSPILGVVALNLEYRWEINSIFFLSACGIATGVLAQLIYPLGNIGTFPIGNPTSHGNPSNRRGRLDNIVYSNTEPAVRLGIEVNGKLILEEKPKPQNQTGNTATETSVEKPLEVAKATTNEPSRSTRFFMNSVISHLVEGSKDAKEHLKKGSRDIFKVPPPPDYPRGVISGIDWKRRW